MTTSRRMPTALREIQRRVAGWILDPSVLDEDGPQSDAIVDLVRGSDRPSTLVRLGAHTGGYPARIREALLEAYPAVEHVVGAATFASAARRYLPDVPAGVYSLGEVGAGFEAFVRADELGRRYPFLADLARLEWCIQAAFHARLQPPLDPAPLASWPLDSWSRAVLAFQPGVALVSSQWPVVDVWRSRQTPIEEISIVLEGRPQCALVHRVGYRVACSQVDPAQAAALHRLLAGDALGAALQTLTSDGDSAAAVNGWFASWMRDGIVVSCVAPPQD